MDGWNFPDENNLKYDIQYCLRMYSVWCTRYGLLAIPTTSGSLLSGEGESEMERERARASESHWKRARTVRDRRRVNVLSRSVFRAPRHSVLCVRDGRARWSQAVTVITGCDARSGTGSLENFPHLAHTTPEQRVRELGASESTSRTRSSGVVCARWGKFSREPVPDLASQITGTASQNHDAGPAQSFLRPRRSCQITPFIIIHLLEFIDDLTLNFYS